MRVCECKQAGKCSAKEVRLRCGEDRGFFMSCDYEGKGVRVYTHTHGEIPVSVHLCSLEFKENFF